MRSSHLPLLLLMSGLLLTIASPAYAEDARTWHFKYFAGDPPTWKDHPGTFAIKAECEIARAEKTTAGYPVGDCFSLPKVSTHKVPTPKATPKPTKSSAQKVSGIAAKRKQKLAQGCRVGCEDDLLVCMSSLPNQLACIQAENTSCIERCTRIEQLPHHTCINEVCLPNEINTATWQGVCESQEERARKACDTTRAACLSACSP